jgi:thioredoxin-like negative regulator of GroEL
MATRTLHELSGFNEWDEVHQGITQTAELHQPCIVIASAQWCAPCKSLKQSILNADKLTDKEFERAKWFVLDIDQNHENVRMDLGIKQIPQIVFVHAGDRSNVEIIRSNHLSKVKQLLKA